MKGINMKKFSSVISLSFLVLFLLVSCNKSSSEWIQYDVTDEGVWSYKKVNNENDEGNYMVQVWDRLEFTGKSRGEEIENFVRFFGRSTKGYDRLSHREDLQEIDCKNHRYRLLGMRHIDMDGKVLYSVKFDKSNDWVNIPSGSRGGIVMKTVCN
jgi:hypothetical protein